MSIRALLSRADGSDEAVDLVDWKPRAIRDDELLWVDIEREDQLEPVHRALGLNDAIMRRLEVAATPGVVVLDGSVEVGVLALADDIDADPIPLRIVTGDGWILTQHPAQIGFLERHRERIQDQREVGRLAPLQFLASVLHWHVDDFFRAAEALERDVDQLDDAALRTERGDLLDRMVALRRRIARVRRLLTPHRDLAAQLSRPDFVAGTDVEADSFATVAKRLERAAEAIANAREMLIGTFDIHMTRTAQRTNDTMRVLTLASVILLPSVVLAGIMGMNFRVGLFEISNLFWVVVAVMVAMAVATVLVARRRGWL